MSAFEGSGLLLINLASKLEEFGTLERTLAADDSGSELEFKADFLRAVTSTSPRIYKAYTSYID